MLKRKIEIKTLTDENKRVQLTSSTYAHSAKKRKDAKYFFSIQKGEDKKHETTAKK